MTTSGKTASAAPFRAASRTASAILAIVRSRSMNTGLTWAAATLTVERMIRDLLLERAELRGLERSIAESCIHVTRRDALHELPAGDSGLAHLARVLERARARCASMTRLTHRRLE